MLIFFTWHGGKKKRKKSPPSLINTGFHMYAYTHTHTYGHKHSHTRILLTGWDFEGHSFSPSHRRLSNSIKVPSNDWIWQGSTPKLAKCVYISAGDPHALGFVALKKFVTRISPERYIFRGIVFGLLRDFSVGLLLGFVCFLSFSYVYAFIFTYSDVGQGERVDFLLKRFHIYRTMTRSSRTF